jgi:hypothetical protein
VQKEAHLRLVDWSAVEAANIGTRQEASTCHIVGHIESSNRYCFSSEIGLFDPTTRRATAKNGTVYELIGAANPGSIASAKFYKWAHEKFIHLRNSTREFAYAMALGRSAVYTVALATTPQDDPTAIGMLRLQHKGALCDAEFSVTAWSGNQRTVCIRDYPNGAESLCSLLVRLLQKMARTEYLNFQDLTPYFRLSIHLGTTTHNTLVIEALETTTDLFGKRILEYTDMHGGVRTLKLDDEWVAPVECCVSLVPELWTGDEWSYANLIPLDQHLRVAPASCNLVWRDVPWKGIFKRLHTWAPSNIQTDGCVDTKRMHSHLKTRYFGFFRGDWSPKYDRMEAWDEWERFLAFNGIKPSRDSLRGTPESAN